MAECTYRQAARILDDHGMRYRPANREGYIVAQTIYSDGSETWDEVRMTVRDLRDWLGY